MAKKNPSVLWTVEQSLAKAEKKKARANIGVDTLSSQSVASNAALTFVTQIAEDATTGNLSCKTANVNVLDTYQDNSSVPASGKAIKAAIDKLDLNNTLSDGYYYSGIKVQNGVAAFTQSAMDREPKLNSNSPVTSDGVAQALNAKVINNASLKIQKNSVDVATFTANAATDVTANISVPTKTSDLNNDSGFITSESLPSVGDGLITIQTNSVTVGTFTVNQSANKTIDISVPEYTAGTDVKISSQNVISSLHGLKSYSRTQSAGGDMVEDDLVQYTYHICPPTMVDNVKLNNVVYEYKVTDVTNCLWIDLRHVLTPDSDGYVTNMHYILDFTGEITDNSNPQYVDPNKDSILLNVGYGDPKAQIAGYSARYIPVKFGYKYLVDIYGNAAHVSLLGADRVQNIAENFGDVHEMLSTTPQTTTYTFEYNLDLSTVYHLDILTNALQAESTDKFQYRIAIGIPGAQNNKYLTGWNRVDSGKSIHQHLDFVSTNYSTRWFIEFDQANYPMATQTVNLMVVGTKERF